MVTDMALDPAITSSSEAEHGPILGTLAERSRIRSPSLEPDRGVDTTYTLVLNTYDQ